MTKRRVGTQEKKTLKSAYEKRRGRHAEEENGEECLRQREEVGTKGKKATRSAYEKRRGRHTEEENGEECLQKRKS